MFLYVKALEASDVPKMDIGSKSDPYLLFKLSTTAQTWKTKYIKNTDKPVWNETFKIPLMPNMRDQLKIELYDKDDISKDDFISSLTFDVKSFKVGLVTDQWYDFKPGKKIKNGGRVRLAFCVDEKNKDPFV